MINIKALSAIFAGVGALLNIFANSGEVRLVSHDKPLNISFVRSIGEHAEIGTEITHSLGARAESRFWRMCSIDTPFDITSQGRLRVIGHLNYEQQSSWVVCVNAMNAGEEPETYMVLVKVVNEPEEPAVVVTPDSGLITSEAGDIAEFSVALRGDKAPLAPVRIPLYSTDMGEGRLSTKELVFTPDNWTEAKTVVVTGINDSITDGTGNYRIQAGIVESEDPAYAGLKFSPVKISNLDNDLISVTPVIGLATTENGRQATFQIRLTTEPWDSVTIDLSSSDESEGFVSPSQVTFEPDNWDQPKTVVVMGIDDHFKDGSVEYSIITSPAVSLDSSYLGLDPDDVVVTNIDSEGEPVAFFSFASNNYEVNSLEKKARIAIKRYGYLAEEMSIDVLFDADTAAMGCDFGINNPIVFPQDQTIQYLDITIPENMNIQGSETLMLRLAKPSYPNTVVGSAQITVSVPDIEQDDADDVIIIASRQRNVIPISFAEQRRNLHEAGLVDESEPISVKAEGLPDGAKIEFDPMRGRDVLYWRPGSDQVGDHIIQLKALYMYDETEQIDLHIRVVNPNDKKMRP